MSDLELILASASAARQRLLRRAGVVFDSIPAALAESELRADGERRKRPLAEIALDLAAGKARHVGLDAGQKFVIGADQILGFKGTSLGKPLDLAAARTQLEALCGEVHDLHTAVVIYQGETELWRYYDRARLKMRRFTPHFLDQYLKTVGPGVLDSVGGYQIEGAGLQLFEWIEGDYFSILGLPLVPLLQILRDIGVVQS